MHFFRSISTNQYETINAQPVQLPLVLRPTDRCHPPKVGRQPASQPNHPKAAARVPPPQKNGMVSLMRTYVW